MNSLILPLHLNMREHFLSYNFAQSGKGKCVLNSPSTSFNVHSHAQREELALHSWGNGFLGVKKLVNVSQLVRTGTEIYAQFQVYMKLDSTTSALSPRRRYTKDLPDRSCLGWRNTRNQGLRRKWPQTVNCWKDILRWPRSTVLPHSYLSFLIKVFWVTIVT